MAASPHPSTPDPQLRFACFRSPPREDDLALFGNEALLVRTNDDATELG
jgi:hypothetical protein